jgi:hypothetical protein
MSAGEPSPDPPAESAAREVAGCLVELAAVVLLALACALGPMVAAVLLSPWVGAAVAAGALGAWAWLGPRPYPGFLPGCLCLSGFAAILGSLLACLGLAVRGLVA